MSKYLRYKPDKNCAKIPNGCHNISVSLGDRFLAHPVHVVMYVFIRSSSPLNFFIYHKVALYSKTDDQLVN